MRLFRFSLLALAFALVVSGMATPVHILSTGDMHGWLQGQEVDRQWLGGAAEMLAYWRQVEHYQPKQFLVLSCGDIATGPALSTVSKGDPVIAVMNDMGYDASVMGNHEFDFGREHFDAWKKAAKFPFLAANLVKADGTLSDMALPYVLYDEQGVKVGIIGLITADVANIAGTGGLVAVPYADTLRKYVPEVRARGAQVVIVLAHVPMSDLEQLAKQVTELNIPLMLGGHSHELGQVMVKDTHTWVVNNGEWWKAYTRIDLDFNPNTGKTIVQSTKQVWLQQDAPKADRKVRDDITHWQQLMDAQYGHTLGYTATGFTRSQPMANFMGACYLGMDPTADAVVFNDGGFRQDIGPGEVNKGVIISVLPFTNSLYRITLTGKQLLSYRAPEQITYAGLRRDGEKTILLKTGQPIDPTASYHLLVTDYLYNKSPDLKAADPNPVTTAQDYRQPVLDWLAKNPTSKEKPLEMVIEAKAVAP